MRIASKVRISIPSCEIRMFFPWVLDCCKSTNLHGDGINSYFCGNDGWWKRCSNDTNWIRTIFCWHYEKSYPYWFWTVAVFVKMCNEDSSWFLMKSTNFSSLVEESYDL